MVQFLKPLLNLFLETTCPLCDRSTSQSFCIYCERQIQQCQRTNPAATWQGSLPIFAWAEYRDALKRAIAVLKYHDHPELAQPLGQWMAEAWQKQALAKQTKFAVVPIPMHQAKQKQRGYNQAELLAKSFCQGTKLPFMPQGLQRIRATEAQFSLSATEREQNLKEAFQVSQTLRKQRQQASVLLLDDIYTTGATVRSAARALSHAGVHVKGVITLAIATKDP